MVCLNGVIIGNNQYSLSFCEGGAQFNISESASPETFKGKCDQTLWGGGEGGSGRKVQIKFLLSSLS